MVNKIELMDVSLSLLKFMGVHPNQKLGCLNVIIWNNSIRVVYLYLIFLLAYKNKDDVNTIMVAVGSISPFLQGFAKAFPFIFCRQDVKALVNNLGVVGSKYNNVSSFTFWKKALVFYKYTPPFAFVIIGIAALVTSKMAFPTYVPEFPHAFLILTVVEYVTLIIDATIVVATDLFFFSMCLVIRQDFEELEKSLLEIDRETDVVLLKGRFKKFIEDHVNLLDYTSNLIRAYSFTLLMQYAISTGTICIELVVLTDRQIISEIIPAAFYILGLLGQLAVYCFPAEEITQMGLRLAYSIYHTKWYRYPTLLQKYIVLIIARSQKPLFFTAGGMMTINRAAFTTIFKGSLSFYTLVKEVKDQ